MFCSSTCLSLSDSSLIKGRTTTLAKKSVIWLSMLVWHFMTNILEAVNALNENSNYHGDIFPDFVYYDRYKKILKIFDPIFFDTRKAGIG